ncbi:MAG: aldo/keto reductase [Propionibacteriaceae bacterium]|jgi:aryl-alcohol dehydrogenase-like predicted oxidoreductase|nr:aldo/keto reductase [Propionibacteriaceae bacterium]
MRITELGNSDVQVSRLGLGSMTWGSGTGPNDVVALLKRFVDAGGNLVDTAAAYGFGEVETLIGHILSHTINRDDLVLATKSGFVLRGGDRVIDTSRVALLEDLAGSLRRMGTDHVDLWQVHAWGDAPIEETMMAIDEAVAKGMARAAGVSNFVGWQVGVAATWQRALHRHPLVAAQAEYSLLNRRAELELLPCVSDLGMGFLPWSALGRGVLTGKYESGTPKGSRRDSSPMAWFVEEYLDEGSRRIVKAVMTAAEGLELRPEQVAYLWVRDAPGVTSPLVGPRTVEQLEPLLEVDSLELPPAIIAALDDVSGGPNAGRGVVGDN